MHPSGFREEGKVAGSTFVKVGPLVPHRLHTVGATGVPVHISLHFSPSTDMQSNGF